MNVVGIIGLLLGFLIGVIFVFVKKLRIIGVAVLVCGIGFGLWQWRKEERWSRGFATAQDGSSQDQISALLGSPTSSANSATPPFGYSLAHRDKRVKKEFWYVSFYFPEQFTFGFDERGVLVARARYASP